MYKISPKIICITRIKNESWFLKIFLKCTELWADQIILADQNSTDDTVKIASKFKKVRIIKVSDRTFNEHATNKLLITTARQTPGPKILFGIDVDEIFTANLLNSPTWTKILRAPKGTEIRFSWACITPDLKHYWEVGPAPRAYVDDGINYQGTVFHSSRLPSNSKIKPLIIENVKQFHFQYTDRQRMQSKHRWYQMFDRIQNPHRSLIEIFRMYHHMYSIPKNMFKPIPKNWFKNYQIQGIDISSFRKDNEYWWDNDVLKIIQKYGATYFRKEDIWYVNWEEIAKQKGYQKTDIFKDPRSFWIKLLHVWLRISQPYSKSQKCIKIDSFLDRYFVPMFN